VTGWSSLRLNVARLRRQPTPAELKKRAQVDSAFPVDATVVAQNLGITTSRIPEGSDVRVVGSVEATLSGLEAKVRVSSTWEGECRRCLDIVTEPIELDLVVPFVPDHEVDDDAEVYPIVGDIVDVGEVVREELMLALPLSPLCSEDCLGADPDRFDPTAEANDSVPGDDADGASIDPRWAALSALTFDDDEESGEADTL